MDFNFTEEQRMLLDAARRFLAREYGFERRRAILASADGYSREVWQGLADLGLLALNIPEEHGGLGGSMIDTMLAMNVAGETLLLEPYLASAVVATRALARQASDAQCAELLPTMASGEKIAILAHDEPASRFDRMAIETRAWRLGNGYVLSGHKSAVAHLPCADILLVTARLAVSDTAQPGPLALFALPRATEGVRRLAWPMVDGTHAGELWLEQAFVPATALVGHADAEAVIEQALDAGLAAVCAEAVGALDRLLAATVEYARTRQQFGVPIGKFQALQHRMADMVLHVEQARSISYLAAVRCTDPDASARRRTLAAAKVTIGQACRFVGQQAVQLHGGMGVTDELDVGHYFKRLMAIEQQFGSTDHHLESYAALL